MSPSSTSSNAAAQAPVPVPVVTGRDDQRSDGNMSFFAQGGRSRLGLGLFVGIAVLAVAFILRNPAVALLGGCASTLIAGVNPLAGRGHYGKLCLQTAIVLLGFTLSIDTLVDVTSEFAAPVAVYVLGTLGLGMLLARMLGAEQPTGFLLASGTAICGGTAIASLAPVVQARSHQVAVALAVVFLLNGFALMTFPLIGEWLELSQRTFGAWVALAIHDTSSVVATAAVYGEEALQVATTVKLGRTLWLIPVIFAAGMWSRSGETRLRIPTFVILFVLAAVVGSLLSLPDEVASAASFTSKALLVLALFAVGLELNRATLAAIRGRAVVMAVTLWLIVAPVSLALVMWI